MKLIAHRGASLLRRENTAEGLNLASRLGADAVECDLRLTGDGQIVLFHDPDLLRIAGAERKLDEISYGEMAGLVERAAGYRPPLLKELLKEYRGTAPVLFHINLKTDRRLIEAVQKAEFSYICGVDNEDAVRQFAQYLPPERILGFLPSPEDAERFYSAGAGILRLWQNWLEHMRPAELRERCPGAEVWVMANRNGSLDGDTESLDEFVRLGADGVLLNDIELGLRHRAANHEAD